MPKIDKIEGMTKDKLINELMIHYINQTGPFTIERYKKYLQGKSLNELICLVAQI